MRDFTQRLEGAEIAVTMLFHDESTPLLERLAAVEKLLEQLDKVRTALEDEALKRKPRCGVFVAMDETCGEPLPCQYHPKQ